MAAPLCTQNSGSTAITIRYSVNSSDAAAHILDLHLTISDPSPAGQNLSLPNWIPGSYMIRDYSRHLSRLEASCNGHELQVEKLGKASWKVQPCDGPLSIRYQVYAWDLSVRGSHVDRTHSYFNGPCVFLEVAGQSDETHLLDLEVPKHAGEHWTLATSLRPKEVDERGFGQYVADSYADLIDHPVEIGALNSLSFEVAGLPHRFVFNGAPVFDEARFVKDVQQVLSELHLLLGTPTDLDRYVFLAMVTANGYGGLEHSFGSSLAVSRKALPQPGGGPMSDEYRQLLGLISHEYFHLWNIKRMKPAVFRPYDLRVESHTGLLWVFEGITSYYDDLALVRSGVISEASYLEVLAQQLTRVLRVPGRHRQSLYDSSFDAWTKLYKRDENADNSIISYYTKGSIVALALDLSLRAAGQGSLDVVMREAWLRYGETGVGMPESGFEDLVCELAGKSWRDFFARFVHGTEDPLLDELFASVGIDYGLRSRAGLSDAGGSPSDQCDSAWLGMRLASDASGAVIVSVQRDSPATLAGLSAGDVIVAVDGLKASEKELLALQCAGQPDQTLTVSYFRRDEFHQTELSLGQPPLDTCYLQLRAEGSHESARQAWLSSAQR
ncbi:MAG: PDZ domain-containing protein [Pseudomonadota bacterium]